MQEVDDFGIPRHIEWISPELPIDRSDVAAVERVLGVRFPPLFIACVMKYNGAHVIPGSVDVPNRGTTVLESLIPLSTKSPSGMHVVRVFHSIRARLREGVVPFGSEPAGNFFCFDFADVRSGEPAVIFWDHERAFRSVDAGIFRVCGNFAELLDSLYDSISEEDDAELRRLAAEEVDRERWLKRADS